MTLQQPDNSAFHHTPIVGFVEQTDDATPRVLAIDIPVGDLKVVYLDVFMECFDIWMTMGRCWSGRALFVRGPNGTLLRLSQVETPIFTTFGAPQPIISAAADDVNKKIVLTLTGKAAVQLRWHGEVAVTYTT